MRGRRCLSFCQRQYAPGLLVVALLCRVVALRMRSCKIVNQQQPQQFSAASRTSKHETVLLSGKDHTAPSSAPVMRPI